MAFLVLEVLAGLEIDGVSQILTLFKNVADGGRTPAVHIFEGLIFVHALAVPGKVSGRNEDFFFFQPAGDLIRTVAVNRHGKDALDHLGGFGVNQPLVSCFVPKIAVNDRACEVLAGLAFGLESGTDFTAGVSGVVFVHNVAERGKIIVPSGSINAIIDSNETDTLLSQNFHDLTDFQIMEILRQRGVRLIAINDGVDSARGDDDFTPFRNIMNEYYARDTSRKIRSTFQAKGKTGKHLTGLVIYGYLWNETRDQWLVDEYSAEVVKRIFSMTIEGMGPYQIANRLKEEKVLIPSAYLAQFNEGVNKNKTFKDVYGWGSSTICNILDKREYLGHTINFKTRKHFKDKKSHYVPEDEWTIFENTHEAIIDQETFDLAQKVRSKVRRYPDGWGDVAPLTGLLYCADCGGKMYVHRFNNGKRISQYTCSKYSKIPVGTLCKTQHRINESVVLELVKDLLKAIAEYAKHERAEFVRVVQEAQSSQQTAEVKKQRTRLATAKQRISELEVLLCKIYEDNILGKLSDSRYATLDAQYEKEQKELTAEISTLEKAISDYEKHEKDADRFIALIDKYENFDELTITMLNEFVEKILVHERDRKGSIQTTQEVEIYFNFVGRFVPPKFAEVELTPEELEEIRKREERKDRLHQNYLKRKASGWQRQYEDRTKAKKKAEMDAKKNALRAEDIAKGVFIPVSNMPKLEPKIAPQKGA